MVFTLYVLEAQKETTIFKGNSLRQKNEGTGQIKFKEKTCEKCLVLGQTLS